MTVSMQGGISRNPQTNQHLLSKTSKWVSLDKGKRSLCHQLTMGCGQLGQLRQRTLTSTYIPGHQACHIRTCRRMTLTMDGLHFVPLKRTTTRPLAPIATRPFPPPLRLKFPRTSSVSSVPSFRLSIGRVILEIMDQHEDDYSVRQATNLHRHPPSQARTHSSPAERNLVVPISRFCAVIIHLGSKFTCQPESFPAKTRIPL